MSATCKYNGVEYSEGSVVCQAGTAYECTDQGTWRSLHYACDQNLNAVSIMNNNDDTPDIQGG